MKMRIKARFLRVDGALFAERSVVEQGGVYVITPYRSGDNLSPEQVEEARRQFAARYEGSPLVRLVEDDRPLFVDVIDALMDQGIEISGAAFEPSWLHAD